MPDQVKGDDHPAVHELRQHALWSEGMVWCSPERHGQITGIMKAQIDHDGSFAGRAFNDGFCQKLPVGRRETV